MAPEEFRKGAIIDQRTNVYTLGATAFVPLSNNRREEAEWQYSPNLYPIVKKAISPNQQDRFVSVKSLRDT